MSLVKAGGHAGRPCAVVPAQAEWRRAESPKFIAFGEVSEAAMRERWSDSNNLTVCFGL